MMMTPKERGFSLIELMISLLLGVILTLGVTQIYLSNSQTYRLTDGLAKLQENVRFTNSVLARDLRGAGNRGCMIDGIGAGVQELRQLPSGPIVPNGASVVGWEHANSGPGDTFTLSGDTAADGSNWSNTPNTAFPDNATDRSNFVQGTDAFIIKGTYPNGLNGNQVGANAGNNNNIPITDGDGNNQPSGIPGDTVIELVSPDCDASFRFVKGNDANAVNIAVSGNQNVPAANISNPAINSPDSRVLRYRTSLYFIGQGASGESALFRQSLENPNTVSPPEELIAGVENMQLLYGLGDRDGVDQYVTADDVALNNWQDVVAVRVAVLMRSDERVRRESEVRTYNLLGAEATTPDDRRVRLLSNKTFALRNRLE